MMSSVMTSDGAQVNGLHDQWCGLDQVSATLQIGGRWQLIEFGVRMVVSVPPRETITPHRDQSGERQDQSTTVS